jgi:hypothetical protein
VVSHTVRKVVSLPLWALFVVGFGSPILTFVGVLIAQMTTRKGATEVEGRAKREETMRNLRWAAELAVSLDARMADLGVAQLVALLSSNLLDESEKIFVEAALDAVYENPEAQLDQWDEDAEVIQLLATDRPPTSDSDPEVFSTTEAEDGGKSDD